MLGKAPGNVKHSGPPRRPAPLATAAMRPIAPAPYEVRCPLHGSIPFDEAERAIIDHPLVQRLRYISQLGFAALV